MFSEASLQLPIRSPARMALEREDALNQLTALITLYLRYSCREFGNGPEPSNSRCLYGMLETFVSMLPTQSNHTKSRHTLLSAPALGLCSSKPRESQPCWRFLYLRLQKACASGATRVDAMLASTKAACCHCRAPLHAWNEG